VRAAAAAAKVRRRLLVARLIERRSSEAAKSLEAKLMRKVLEASPFSLFSLLSLSLFAGSFFFF